MKILELIFIFQSIGTDSQPVGGFYPGCLVILNNGKDGHNSVIR